MLLSVQLRENLLAVGGEPLAQEFDNLMRRIMTSWQVEHLSDTDGHKDITAWSVLARKSVQNGTTGNVTADAGFYERLRTTRLGEWISAPFLATNFTSSGGGTWTLQAGDQVLYRYTLIGKTMTVSWEFTTTSVSGGQAQLRFAIPGGYLSAQTVFVGGMLYSDAGAAFVSGGNVFVVAGGNFIALEPGALFGGVWAAAVNNTDVRGTVTFEIQ